MLLWDKLLYIIQKIYIIATILVFGSIYLVGLASLTTRYKRSLVYWERGEMLVLHKVHSISSPRGFIPDRATKNTPFVQHYLF